MAVDYGSHLTQTDATAYALPTYDIKRLKDAVEESRKKLESSRRPRKAMIEEYKGRNFSYDEKKKSTPLNFLRSGAKIYQRQLVPQNPKALVSTKHAELKPTAYAMRVWMNHRIVEMGLQSVLRRAVLDALFSFAVVKVGLAVDDSSYEYDPGQPFCELIDLDDWVMDMSVRDPKHCAYMGHRMRRPLRYYKNGDFENIDKLKHMPRQRTNEQGDERTNARTVSIDNEDLEDMVEVWEIWLARDNLVLTVLADEQGGLSHTVLREQTFVGPECGPYHILGYDDVPGELLHAGPMQDMYDLHLILNEIFRKLSRQASRQKSIGVTVGQEQDAKNIMKTNDGSVANVSTPDALKELRYGGPDAASLAFLLQSKPLLDELGGNLRALGGLGTQAETLGQDQLIYSQASKQVQEMSTRTVEFVQGLLQSLAWFWWTDPVRTYSAEESLPGTGESVVLTITPEQREADFLELNFKIDPYSLQPSTPGTRLQAIMQLLQTVLLPGMQAMMQQGVTIAWEPLLRLLAELLNMDEVEQFVQFTQQPPMGETPFSEPPTKASVSQRNYTRTSVPSGAAEQQGQQQMMAGLMQMQGGQGGMGGAA